MSKLKNCPSCKKEVSTSAKLCPHCGKKLKMGLFLKFIILIVALAVGSSLLSPSAEDEAKAFEDKLDQITNTQPSPLSASGELSQIFSMMSDHTDIQRENKEKEIKGKIVDWTLAVYDVDKQSQNTYKVQTSGSKGVGTFTYITTRNSDQRSYVENLKTGDSIRVKGEITGTFFRNIVIKPAIIIQ